MTNKEFVETLRRVLDKAGARFITVSDDPDFDADFGFNDRGYLIFDHTDTPFPVSSITRIRYGYDEPNDADAVYLLFDFENDLHIRYYIVNREYDLRIHGTPFVGSRAKEIMKYYDGSDMIIRNDVYVAYLGEEETVVVPEGVKIIGDDAFAYNRNIRKVILPDSVHTIGDRAFTSSSIDSIEMKDSVQRIGKYAFCDCVNLKSLEIPKSVTQIDRSAFARSGLFSISQIVNESLVTFEPSMWQDKPDSPSADQ